MDDFNEILEIQEGNHLWRSKPAIGDVLLIGDCKADEKPEIVREIVRYISPDEFQEKVKEWIPTLTVFGGWEIKTSPAATESEKKYCKLFYD